MRNPVILCDFDGTIADSLPCLLEIYNRIAPALKAEPITQQMFNHLRLLPARQAVKAMGVSKRRLTSRIPFILREYRSMIDRIQPYPGIREVLQQLANRGITMGLLSSNSTANLQEFLQRHNIYCFAMVIGTGGIMRKHAAIRKCMRENSIPRDTLIYVGDEIRDIKAARKCKVRCAAVTWGMHPESMLVQQKPDVIIRQIEDLLSLPKLI